MSLSESIKMTVRAFCPLQLGAEYHVLGCHELYVRESSLLQVNGDRLMKPFYKFMGGPCTAFASGSCSTCVNQLSRPVDSISTAASSATESRPPNVYIRPPG